MNDTKPKKQPLTDADLMPFGKYKGAKLGDMRASYLLWLFDQDWLQEWPRLQEYIAANLDSLAKEQKGERRNRD